MGFPEDKADGSGWWRTVHRVLTSYPLHEILNPFNRGAVPAGESSVDPTPEYRVMIEEALESADSPAASRALLAYQREPLRLINSAHYPVIYSALHDYAEQEPRRNIEPVIHQLENVMHGT